MKREIRKTYREQLADPRWIQLRNRLVEERGCCFFCEDAGHASDERFVVHHTEYRDGLMAWEYGEEELVVCCKKCHDLLHEFADRTWHLLLKLAPQHVGAVRDAIEALLEAEKNDRSSLAESMRSDIRNRHENMEERRLPEHLQVGVNLHKILKSQGRIIDPDDA